MTDQQFEKFMKAFSSKQDDIINLLQNIESNLEKINDQKQSKKIIELLESIELNIGNP